MARRKFTTALLIALAATTACSAGLVHHTCGELREALIDEPTPSKCHWRGSAPFCEEQTCPEGYQLIGSDVCGDGWCCWTGIKINCCPKSSAVSGDGEIETVLKSTTTGNMLLGLLD